MEKSLLHFIGSYFAFSSIELFQLLYLADDVAVKITTIRTTYVRCKKMGESGSAAAKAHWIVSKLRFLDNFIKPRASMSNLDVTTPKVCSFY